jgi:CRISPR-associated protein Cas5d
MALRPHAVDEIGKYLDQFNRRVKRGQCHHTPCFGTREFSVFFEHPAAEDCGAVLHPELTLDLGQMLFEIAYVEARDGRKPELEFWRATAEGRRKVGGYAMPLFFHAKLEQGVLGVRAEEYARLYEMEDGNA